MSLTHSETLNPRDFRLLKVGRHFRIGLHTKVIIGRDESENSLLEHLVQEDEAAVRWLDGNGPLGVITGVVDRPLTETAGSILLRYTKAAQGQVCRLQVVTGGQEVEVQVVNAIDETTIDRLRL